ncbi:type VI secretion system-associated protein TagF [Neorhizobium galegae]|uniref:Putative type VI secretion protein TagF n=1 Tax=Neorhizobium galegae bv. orientalis str. HAMBI 540 TaxID=1028800 RepID=A0A068T099_NEOGA|nr:type VI secretion system-associated protein TagF [Neorhizobium galegae]CDN51833.1 Putative type VI secretion protein TagF [Neorhizobium galegae bv. orientalis str. HAMBI 540]CDZ51771.1 Putative type VI secretion protein TagF [Neorhizobium galegae bv. orientalis]
MPSLVQRNSDRATMNERATLGQIWSETDRLGFFGKLPSHGDFVSIGLGRKLQAALDAWLQSSLHAIQAEFGNQWERRFRSMPSWRFIVDRDLWGPATVAGVIVPSLDRVGRSFPLVLAAQLQGFSGDPRSLCLDDTWFIATEGLAETSARHDFNIDTFTTDLKRLRPPRPGQFDGGVEQSSPTPPGTLWWRMDPDDRRMKGFRVGGAPGPLDFLKLLPEGDAKEAGQPGSGLRQQPAVAEPKPAPAEAPGSLKLFYSYASHPGTRLSLNADSIFISATPSIFAIADGVGDGSVALEASRIAIDMLSRAAPQETIEALVQELKGKLGKAHGVLQSGHLTADRSVPSASIVILASLHESYSILWAGDARSYLLRDGMMRCLTRDHAEIGLRRSLARGIGLKGQLVPEVVSDRLRPGDRLLLCSNPLPRILSERAIAEILLAMELDEVSAVLTQEALIANCRENLTVMVIDVKADRG